ncbi:MAG: glucosylglycerol hydrolase, partial [Pseudomonadota bacterium]
MNIMQSAASVSRNDAATDALIEFVREEMAGAETSFDAARAIARRLGAQKNGAVCEVGFWAPELLENRVPDGDIFLEVLEAEEPLHLTTARQQVRFRRHRLPMARYDAYAFIAVEGMTAGDRETLGSFYALAWRDAEGEWRRVLDPLSASLPFGAFAPAEYYDVAAMQAARGDRAYFEALGGTAEAPVKIGPAASILQIHVPTATAGRTLASLTRHLEHVAERVGRDLPLEAADRLFAGYEAIQLLPVEPTTVYEAGPDFWTEEAGDADDVLSVDLRRPDTTNWGYDVVIAGMAGVLVPVIFDRLKQDPA